MRKRHSHRITRRTAGQLLDGTAAPGPQQLIRVLSAATAPAREGELAGEKSAMAAFEASRPLGALPPSHVVTPRKRKMFNFPLAKLLTVKVAAWSLAGLATAGAAATAGTVAFTGATPVPAGSASASVSAPAGPSGPAATAGAGLSGSAPAAQAGPSAGAGASASASASASSSGGGAPLSPVRLCTDLTSKVASVIGDAQGAANTAAGDAGLASVLASPALTQVLATPAFASLISAAGGATAVPDYCGLLMRLPTVPVPAAFTQLPASVVTKALATLPAGDLAGVLRSLPAGGLSRTLGELSPAQLSSLLSALPAPAAGSVLSQLPGQ